MFKTQLTVTLRQPQVKNQLQAANKIVLANLVFTNNNNTLTRFNINIGEVGKLINRIREIRITASLSFNYLPKIRVELKPQETAPHDQIC